MWYSQSIVKSGDKHPLPILISCMWIFKFRKAEDVSQNLFQGVLRHLINTVISNGRYHKITNAIMESFHLLCNSLLLLLMNLFNF